MDHVTGLHPAPPGLVPTERHPVPPLPSTGKAGLNNERVAHLQRGGLQRTDSPDGPPQRGSNGSAGVSCPALLLGSEEVPSTMLSHGIPHSKQDHERPLRGRR
jgi:hypothetical protein